MENIVQIIESKIDNLNNIDALEDFCDIKNLKDLTQRYDLLVSLAKENNNVNNKKIIRYKEYLEDEYEYFIDLITHSKKFEKQAV